MRQKFELSRFFRGKRIFKHKYQNNIREKILNIVFPQYWKFKSTRRSKIWALVKSPNENEMRQIVLWKLKKKQNGQTLFTSIVLEVAKTSSIASFVRSCKYNMNNIDMTTKLYGFHLEINEIKILLLYIGCRFFLPLLICHKQNYNLLFIATQFHGSLFHVVFIIIIILSLYETTEKNWMKLH